jgi:capsular polysaccharide transport system permease protein
MTDEKKETNQDSAETGPNLYSPETQLLKQKLRNARRNARRQAKLAAEAQSAFAAAPTAKVATLQLRHFVIIISFLLCVCLPAVITGFYMYTRAADQYASTLGFTVRSEDISSASDLLGGLGGALGGGSGSHDSEILYEFINSQELVSTIDKQLNLREKFSRYADQDPILSFNTSGTIEDLTSYWQRMIRVAYDSGSGLIELRVLAFDPDDATEISKAIYAESTRMINDLSAIARADATRYAKEDLDLAVERLKSAREALTSFRLTNQIVDPNADIQAQMGLLTTLQTQQASALIEFDLISDTASENDPRVEQARRRLEVIEARIADERQKFGVGGGTGGGVEYATTISEFERLTVDREFAERGYEVALATLDAARAEANRQSRYLAAYITPTRAEKSQYPQRGFIFGLVAVFSFLIWAIFTLAAYAFRDRK